MPAIKVAIVHDWLVGGGAERVVLELHRMYPDAPIYTSYCSPEWRKKLDGKVVTGFLQHWPFSRLRKFIGVLRIWWFGHLDFTGYDLVISSSGNGEAKGIKVPEGTKYICYCHSPTHYYWRHYNHYLAMPGFGVFDPLARLGLKLLVGPLRRWDYKVAQRPDYYIANSSHIKDDIKTFYGRDSVVINPPIDLERFNVPLPKQRTGFMTAGRQPTFKRTDLIVEAANKLGVPLRVIGRGPHHKHLVKIAGPTVSFSTNTSDEEMPHEMAKANAFIFASFEDFGITPVEAQAVGTPVIAYRAGGALDYVKPGKTGEFFDEQTVDSLANAMQSFKPGTYDSEAIRASTQEFSPASFQKKFRAVVAKATGSSE